MSDAESITVSPTNDQTTTTVSLPSDTSEQLSSDSSKRPSGVPEKFWDSDKGVIRTEELLKSYQELERSQSKPVVTPDTDVNTPPEKLEEQSTPSAKEAVNNSGLDFSQFESEFAEKGSLSPDTYDQLEKAGFNRSTVDNYIKGVQAIDTLIAQNLENIAGGQSQLDDICSWAVTNLNESQTADFNAAFASRDLNLAKEKMTELKGMYSQSVGISPSLVQGQQVTSGSLYMSQAQVVADMQRPEYAKDPAYRAKVAAKLARSNVL